MYNHLRLLAGLADHRQQMIHDSAMLCGEIR
jgi:hypothetical protein